MNYKKKDMKDMDTAHYRGTPHSTVPGVPHNADKRIKQRIHQGPAEADAAKAIAEIGQLKSSNNHHKPEVADAVDKAMNGEWLSDDMPNNDPYGK